MDSDFTPIPLTQEEEARLEEGRKILAYYYLCEVCEEFGMEPPIKDSE